MIWRRASTPGGCCVGAVGVFTPGSVTGRRMMSSPLRGVVYRISRLVRARARIAVCDLDSFEHSGGER